MCSFLFVDEDDNQDRPLAIPWLCVLPASVWSMTLTTTSELDHPTSSFPIYLRSCPHCSISLVPCAIRALQSAGTAVRLGELLSGHIYGVTATKRQEKCAGPVTCRGNAFTGASSDARSQFIKLWTEIEATCLLVSFL